MIKRELNDFILIAPVEMHRKHRQGLPIAK